MFITTGPDGNLWFAEYHGNQIGKITNGGVITEYAIPTAGSQPVGITTGPDGNIWFTEYNANKIGVIVLSLSSTTTAVTSSLNPSTSGASVTFTATVTGTSPTGFVTFKDGIATLGTASLASGQATLSTSSLSVGTHSITAVYSGDSINSTSTSPVLSQVVNSATTYTISGTITLNGSGLSGVTVTLTGVGTATTTTNGSGAYSFTGLSNGGYTVTPGLSGYTFTPSSGSVTLSGANSTGNDFTATVSSTAISSSLNPSTYGVLVTFTAVVTGISPTGIVTFKDGSNILGTASLNIFGQAAFSTYSLAAGTHSITAVYAGDQSNPASTSSVLSQVVNSATTLTVSLNPSTFGTPVTFTATVIGTSPTGTVTFMDGATALGIVSLVSGQATFTTSSLSVATHSITAVYSGDGNNLTSTSAALSEVVNSATAQSVWVWTANKVKPAAINNWQTVASNSDGTKLIAAVGGGDIWTSSDSGATWTANNVNGGFNNWQSVASDSTGTKLVAVVYGGDIWTSSNGTWTANGVNNGFDWWDAVASNSDGTKLIAAIGSTSGYETGDIWTSSNSGYSWTANNVNGGNNMWQSVASDSTGTKLAAAVYGGDICTYSNGAWTANNVNGGSNYWQSVACNSTGSKLVAAVYNGDIWTGALPVTTTTTSVSSSLNPSSLGDSVTFTATVTGTSPTGTVTFKDGTTILGTASLVNGQATFTSSSLSIGTHQITAVYGGNSNYSASTSVVLNQVISTPTTTTSVTSSLNPATYGAAVTFTATVTGAGSTPAGTVTFMDNATALGNALIANGQAAYTTSSLSPGTHTITAVYSGDNNSTASTLAVLSQVVAPATATTVVTSSLNPSTYGASVTFTATISSTTSPTGTAVFMDNTTTLAALALDGNGQATFTTSALSVGKHSITVFYSGDANSLSSTSSALNQLVMSATATTITSSLNPSKYGAAVTFTATVTGTSPTGTVAFMDNTTTLASVSPNGSGKAAYSTSSLLAGTHPITAVYSGDNNSLSSKSEALNQLVTPATATTLTSSQNPLAYGTALTLTATVTGESPTGIVTFVDNTTMDNTTTLSTLGAVTIDGRGKASIVVTSLAAGTHSIVAVYSGDANNLPSTSTVLSQIVTTIMLTSSQNPANYGVAVTFTAVVMGNSPTGTITFMAGETPLSTVSLDVNGQASLTVIPMIGTYSITAVYSGDANNPASTSAALTQVIESITVTSSMSSSAYGVPVTFTATITGNSPTGTVTFMDNMTTTLDNMTNRDNTTTLGTAALVNGEASLTTAALSIGTHLITALYGGDLYNIASASAPLTQTVIDNNTVQIVSFTVAGSGTVLVYDDNFNLISTQRQGSNTSVPYGTARIFYFQPTEGSVLTSLTVNGRPMRPVSIIRAIMTEDYNIIAVYYP